MSMYNMIHGVNPMSGILLASLGLSREQVGRFRDCYWNGEHICVYTRNGGGNRDCWHDRDPKYGSEGCHGEAWEEEVDEIVELPQSEGVAAGYKQAWTILGGDKQPFRTGRRVMETRHSCGGPNSEKCACPGCTISFRLPQHPNYVSDSDDDFDGTYATVYFRPHPSLADALRAVPAADATPEQKWQSFFDRLQSGAKDDPQIARVLEASQPLIGALSVTSSGR